MKTLEISEFKFLLKMGLWPGGEVSGVGYVSKAAVTTASAPVTGLSGCRIGSGMTLEADATAPGTGYILSVYDPYSGHYTCYAFSVTVRKKATDFMDVMCKGQSKPEQRPPGVNGKHPFYRAPKYTAENTSWRTGYIPKPNTRR